MVFLEVLHSYIKEADCSISDLSLHAGVSERTIKRYLAGERIPAAGSVQIQQLARGIASLADEKGNLNITEYEIYVALNEAAKGFPGDYDLLLSKLNTLIQELSVSRNNLAHYLNYDPSYISRILSGNRIPADITDLVAKISSFIASHYTDSTWLTGLLNADSFSSESACKDAIMQWLLSDIDQIQKEDEISHFLSYIDRFDLNEYIRAIHFDELKTPTVPFQPRNARWCYGIDQMMEAELDFLRSTVLSRSKQDVIMYSDMPMERMSEDLEFPKKWMFGMAMLVKKGLHLHIIHNIDRPLHEMMLGLEAYIPMYMTGLISSYYLKKPQNDVFLHFIRSSGAAAVGGEAISGHQAEGRYYFSRKEEDIQYYCKRAELLLSQTKPLMKIFLKEDKRDFFAFFQNSAALAGSRRFILSTPPLYTMPGNLLEKMLERSGAEDNEISQIKSFHEGYSKIIRDLISEHEIVLEFPMLSREEFASYPPVLDLSGTFVEQDIVYNYEEYREHIEATNQFAEACEHVSIKSNPVSAFRNIQIIITEGENVIVAKSKAPTIIFVITHPNMVKAFEQFIVPMREHL